MNMGIIYFDWYILVLLICEVDVDGFGFVQLYTPSLGPSNDPVDRLYVFCRVFVIISYSHNCGVIGKSGHYVVFEFRDIANVH